MIDFAGDAAAIFADEDGFGVDAIYTPQGGDPVALRVMRRAPTVERGFDGTMISVETVEILALVADIPAPAAGDTITAAGETRVVQGVPQRDDRGLRWRLDTRPQS